MYFVEGSNSRLGSPGFAGTLGESQFPTPIQELLNQVKIRPEDFKQLLFTVSFHPTPMDTQNTFNIGGRPMFLIDAGLMYKLEPPGRFLDRLRRISDDFRKKDDRFRHQFEAALQLRNEMMEAAGKSMRMLSAQTRGPILLEALAQSDMGLPNFGLGLKHAPTLLPASLIQRIRNNEASEAHFVSLGRFLRRYGEVLQTKDAAFKALVEEERMSKQLKHEQENAQQKRKRP